MLRRSVGRKKTRRHIDQVKAHRPRRYNPIGSEQEDRNKKKEATRGRARTTSAYNTATAQRIHIDREKREEAKDQYRLCHPRPVKATLSQGRAICLLIGDRSRGYGDHDAMMILGRYFFQE
ncbi:uncharacterized protein LOC116417242 [Nasonia vitripennis]|uniref:Uncharacterized protein n=1 Tax=Nasonia vitripennis TaxID=7425 RepID=A0A7M7QEB2_NASVI|nr:uncharacterized protein LOC116417242 [Nasonia vitripennis]